MRRLRAMAICAVALGLSAPAAAAGDGGPVPPQQGGAGVSAPGTPDAGYVAVAAGGGTLVQRIARGAGAVERTRVIGGRYGVGAVAFDGSATGLSADGRTLVLAAMPGRRWPPRSTPLAVLDTRRLQVRDRITLPGYWALDAISPDGRKLYLLHYLSPRSDLLRYEVRAYDMTTRRLVADPVVDPREPDEKMQGMAVTRTMSADGRWAYTLYLRPSGGPPFVHALDTVGGTARCVDFPAEVASADISSARLTLSGDGRTLSAGVPGAPVVVDTRSFAVSRPAVTTSAPARRPAPARSRGGRDTGSRDAGTDGGGAWPWALGAIPVLALAAMLTAERRRRVRRPRAPAAG
jgi:hypothetical protein